MLLPDFQIKEYLDKGDLVIDPFEEWMLQPASVDVHLGTEFMVYNVWDDTPINPYEGVTDAETLKFNGFSEVVLAPGESILATTKQRVELPNNIKATVEGKSSLARYFVAVHATAGFIDPGFEGTVTLEITNNNLRRSFLLIPGMPIGQLSFIFLTQPAKKPYGADLGSHYQGQIGVTAPRPLRRPPWKE